jgi:16S rRNA (adenine1518-N6/adenine1519-N6)-dimethyltransferase
MMPFMDFPFAKKSLGQNFLTSTKALSDIISAADVQPGDEVLEVGPGRGVLTTELLKSGAHVTAIEKDTVLVGLLKEMFAKEIEKGQLEVIEGDILDFDFKKPSYKLIANIPYYITGQIFRMFLESAVNQPISMTILVQKEVAERVVARDKKESILSMSVKVYGTPRIVSVVKRGSFNPAPNVDSAILHISDISKTYFSSHRIDEKTFFEVLKASFAHKRKIISKNLIEKGLKHSDSVDPKARAEDLAIEDFALLTQAQVNVIEG